MAVHGEVTQKNDFYGGVYCKGHLRVKTCYKNPIQYCSTITKQVYYVVSVTPEYIYI